MDKHGNHRSSLIPLTQPEGGAKELYRTADGGQEEENLLPVNIQDEGNSDQNLPNGAQSFTVSDQDEDSIELDAKGQEKKQRSKSFRVVQEEQDQFTKKPNDIDKKEVRYTSRRNKNYDDQESDDSDDDDVDEVDPTGVIKYMDTQGNTTVVKPNMRFLNYREIFTNLLKQSTVITKFPIVSMIISYDSTRAIVVTRHNDHESFIKMYDLNTNKLTFEEQIGNWRNTKHYIKVKEVEQNHRGTHYAVVYFDDGQFRLRTFGKTTRTGREIKENELNINEYFGIDNYTMANQDFQDPFITCCWIGDDKVFVNFFHNYSRTHYHFIWHIRKRQVIGVKQETDGQQLADDEDKLASYKLQCSIKNFPYKCFYNPEKAEVYSFYRQGQAFIINTDDPSEFTMEQMTDMDVGQMVMFNNEALICRSSTKVLFFKQMKDLDTGESKWTQYHHIKVRGFIYYIKGNIRIQITTDEKVYFYLIDKETYMPELENVMYNFMGCNQMMFGSRVRYGISYKTNQKSFDIFRRKYMHNLKVCVNDGNFSGSRAIEIVSMNVFLVTQVDKVLMFDSDTFEVCGEIPITLMPTETREPNEIIGMAKSKCEDFVAIVSGKNLVKNEQKQNQLFIFQRKRAKNEFSYDQFAQIERFVVKDIPFFDKVCMQFHFKDTHDGSDPDTILFVKREEIFELNFKTKQFKTIHKFNVEIRQMPSLFTISEDQKQFVICSAVDGFWFDVDTGKEVDLDELYNVDLIRNIIYDAEDKMFYFLANKQAGCLGFFLIGFQQKNPQEYKFMTMWQHKLDLDDANLYILRGNDKNLNKIENCDQSYKELVVSFKTCFVNTYNVIVQDLSGKNEERATLFRHESFQLWESQISGLILLKNKDYVSFSKSGINVLALGSTHKRPIKDFEGANKMIHSLDSLSFLKVESCNFMNYLCQDYNNRVISIEQEFSNANETNFEEIYKVKIFEITLRELLILQSFYICKTQADIVNLVRDQPNPKFFYKSFLELDGSNMVTILAFDSGSMEFLLSEENQEFFDEKFPVIYKTKIPKKKNPSRYFFNTAIDNALKNNQVKAINLMIQYISEYQNNYISSFLFRYNLPKLMMRGIQIYKLIEPSSQIFKITFDYDEWPGNHTNDSYEIRPYNESFFHIRNYYKDIFPEEQFESIEGKNVADQQVFKIKYSINLLPIIGEHVVKYEKSPGNYEYRLDQEDVSLVSIFQETEEIEIFEADCIQELIRHKWETFGRRFHFFGFIMHMLYVILVNIYVSEAYLKNQDETEGRYYVIILCIGIFYPWLYDSIQLFRGGLVDYLSDPWNYADILYIYGSIVNCVIQFIYGPLHEASRIIMCIIVLLLIMKTFFFLRIFPILTPIVVMLTRVISDLKPFLLFYTILIMMFGQTFAVLGLANVLRQGKFQDTYGVKVEETEEDSTLRMLRAGKGKKQQTFQINDSAPGKEYASTGLWVGEMIWAFRISIGDNDAIGPSAYLDPVDNYIFWFCFFITVMASCVVFLNFIVAEASNSYDIVTETLEATIWMEKSSLINEAEDMTWSKYKSQQKFPKYLIVREIEI